MLESLSERRLGPLASCRPLTKEECHSGNGTRPETASRGPSSCGPNSTPDSAESEASDSANTESRGCRTSGSSESMDALEEDDLDACSSSRSSFFHFCSPAFPEGQEERSSSDPGGFFCLLDLAQEASPRCPKAEFLQGPAAETFSWAADLGTTRLDPRLYEGSRFDYYSLCSSVSPASHLSDSSDSTASRGQQAWPEARPSSMPEGLALHPPPLALEDGSSDEEYYDAADKLTPPDGLSGEPLLQVEPETLLITKPQS